MFNRLVVDRCFEESYAIHRKKLQQMKPCGGGSARPERATSIAANYGRAVANHERSRKIARDNDLLLEKLVDITMPSVSSAVRSSPLLVPRRRKTLNGSSRKSELLRITDENRKLLERLITKRSQYSFRKWERDDRERRKYAQFACVYPYTFDKLGEKQRTEGELSMQTELSPAFDREALPPVMRKSTLDVVKSMG